MIAPINAVIRFFGCYHILFSIFLKTQRALENNEFQDCFTKSKQQCPKFTVWSGTAVDFMYLDKKWDLPIAGCHTYYSSASDHLPVIMDVKVKE